MPASVAQKAAATTFSATRSPVLTLPGTIIVGHILYAFFTCTGGDATGTPPAGWAEFEPEVDAGSGLTTAYFWKRADGSETPGDTITFTNLWAATETGCSICFSVQGAIESGDPHAGKASETTTTGTAKDTASATPSVADCLALASFGHTQSRTFLWDAGITEEYDQDTSPAGGTNPGFWIGSKQLSGTPATTMGGDANGNCATTETIWFVKPAVSGTTYTKVGSLTAGSAHTGADVREASEAGSLTSQAGGQFGGVRGADVREAAELGSLVSDTQLSGVGVLEAIERGGLVTGTALIAGGDAVERTRAGTILVAGLLQGADVREAAESGLLRAGTFQGAPKVTERARAAYVAAQSLLAGADAATLSEVGSLIADTVLSGVGAKEGEGKVGSLVAGSRLSGLRAAEFGERGFLAAQTFGAGLKTTTFSKSGILLAQGQLYGADVFTASRTGALVAIGSISVLRQKEAAKAGTIVAKAFLAAVWEELTGYFLDGTEIHMLTSATVEGGRLTGASPEETVIVVTLPERGQLTRVDN